MPSSGNLRTGWSERTTTVASAGDLAPLARRGGLPEEAGVAPREQLDVGPAGAEHRHAVDAGAEREAAVALRVIANLAEHFGIHHAGAGDLHPPRALAHRAGATAAGGAVGGRLALAGAEHAAEVDLGRRLGEREERRSQPQPHVLPE